MHQLYSIHLLHHCQKGEYGAQRYDNGTRDKQPSFNLSASSILGDVGFDCLLPDRQIVGRRDRLPVQPWAGIAPIG